MPICYCLTLTITKVSYDILLKLDIAYTESDDYILKNLRNSVTYGKLLETKGFDNIEERINFLS